MAQPIDKPKRPEGCPLFFHGNGQWARKIHGRFRYFGRDLDAALKRWAAEKDHLLAGLEPPRTDGEPSLSEIANLYLADVRQRMADGKIRADHDRHVVPLLTRWVNALGKDARLSRVTPAGWAKVRRQIELSVDQTTPRAATTIKADCARSMAVLNWIKLKRLVVNEIHIAGAFDPPPMRELRMAKTVAGKRLWEPAELRQVIEASSVLFRPVLLLAINGALGIADIGRITRSQITARTECIDLPRNKTGVDRRIWLWPETRQAIAEAVRKRPTPARQKFDDRLLLTPKGFPWHHIRAGKPVDTGCSTLSKTIERAGMTSTRTLYDCRRSFRTIAGEVCDLEAVNFCMGHEGPGEGITYVQNVGDDRIRRVCEHVRAWLFGSVEGGDV